LESLGEVQLFSLKKTFEPISTTLAVADIVVECVFGPVIQTVLGVLGGPKLLDAIVP
jgi:hypothetical protein